MTKEKETFDYYCIDRMKPLSEEILVTYKKDEGIRKKYFKFGLISNIKRVRSLILYTESNDDLEDMNYISLEDLDNHQEYIFSNIINEEEYNNWFKVLNKINIFEYTSLLDFESIFSDFKDFIEYNWDNLQMDNLIEY